MKLLIATSTLPVSDADPVPAFVKDQAVHLKRMHPSLDIIIYAPHNHYSRTSKNVVKNGSYKEVRFHYFWPFRLELLSGRGIMPALNANKLLYGQIPFLFVSQIVSLWRLVRKEKPDLLYAHWFTPQAISTALISKLTGIPFVFTTHGSDVSVLSGVPFATNLVEFVCKRAHAYSAVSEKTAQRLRGFFSEESWTDRFSRKLTIIPMGVDVRLPAADRDSLEQIRRKHRLDHRPVLLYMGRLAEEKGVVYLLEALALLPLPQRENLQLVIAGDGQLKGILEKKVRILDMPNITFTGYVHGEEKSAILALADYLCLPSILNRFGVGEGFPVVLMEGLAAGKIVLASDVSGAETILKDGENGFLFTQGSPTNLASTLMRALNLPAGDAKALAERSRQLARQFSWDAISSRYYEILKSAVSNEV